MKRYLWLLLLVAVNALAQPFPSKPVTGVGLEPLVQGPAEFAGFLRRDREKYAVRVKNVNVKLD